MRAQTNFLCLGLAIVLAAAPSVALAHASASPALGFTEGMAHPLQGLDHTIAMTAVGMIAGRTGGRALWLLPCAFLSMMALGGLFGMEGVRVPFVEAGILLSLCVFGLAAVLNWNPPTVLAIAVSGLFAVFHGHAHGSEMTACLSWAAYGAGFMLATALLLFTGICFGVGLERALAQKSKESMYP